MIVRLITACGCEQTMDIGASDPGRSIIMPLRPAPIGTAGEFKMIDLGHVFEGRPVHSERRTFIRSQRHDRDGIQTYREDFRPSEAKEPQ